MRLGLRPVWLLIALAGIALPLVTHAKQDCCWCSARYQGDSALGRYFGSRTCEDTSTAQRVCRKIEILSDACQLVKVSWVRGKLTCKSVPVDYRENGIQKTIPAPSETFCDRRAMQSSDPRLSLDPRESRDRIRCICSKMPKERGACVISVTQGGEVLRQVDVRLADEQASCDEPHCQEALEGAELTSTCRSIIRGG